MRFSLILPPTIPCPSRRPVAHISMPSGVAGPARSDGFIFLFAVYDVAASSSPAVAAAALPTPKPANSLFSLANYFLHRPCRCGDFSACCCGRRSFLPLLISRLLSHKRCWGHLTLTVVLVSPPQSELSASLQFLLVDCLTVVRCTRCEFRFAWSFSLMSWHSAAHAAFKCRQLSLLRAMTSFWVSCNSHSLVSARHD